jgi:hypothetical protein
MTEHRALPMAASLTSLGALMLLVSCTPAPTPSAATVIAVHTDVIAPTVGAASTSAAGTVIAVHTDVIAPTVGAASTNVAQTSATAQVAGANVSAMRQATATALAPTAQAVATRVAPTVVAAATQAVGAASTSVAASTVHVANVVVDANDTTVTIQNSGTSPINLLGWTLVLGPNMSVVLGDIPLGAGMTRTLHFSQGIDTPSDVYLGFGSNVASASLTPGSRVVLVQPVDNTIASVYSVT